MPPRDLEEMLADRAARRLVVDADLRDLRAGRQDGVDRDHRDAGGGGRLNGRHDAVDVDRHDHHPVDLVGDVGLDRVVLRRRVVVGVEDDQLGAELLGLLLRALVHLGEEQRLLVDLHQGDRRLGGQRRAMPAAVSALAAASRLKARRERRGAILGVLQ